MIFLGTGGGGKVVFSQTRASGGLYLDLDGIRLLIDPGPGSLVWLRKMGLKNPDGILLSHLHQDHSTDVNAILDGLDNPFLIAEEHCLKITKDYYPCVSKYHQSLVKFLKAVKPNDLVELPNNKIKVEITRAEHYAPTIGFKIIGSCTIGYPSDGPYFIDQEKQFELCDLIIFNVLVPHGEKSEEKKHMSIDDVIEFLNRLNKKPKLAVIQHFSFWMLRNNVYRQAKIVEEETNVKTIAAKDFMQINLENLEPKVGGLREFI